MRVDDIILTVNNLVEYEKLKTFSAKKFEIKNLSLRYFLDMEVVRAKEEI